jgi:catechol 2,3-dioxygenase-like lactoylglutathione lyase family enzyme
VAFHHLAVATRTMPEIDAFYSQAMGFDLVKVEIAPTPEGGWAKHFFYDTGKGELMAFWEIHDEKIGDEFPTALSLGMNLPPWVNHYAFAADDLDDIERKKQRWLDTGYDVLEIDHNWVVSIYTLDPNGTLVEFAFNTEAFSEDDKAIARKAVWSDDIETGAPPKIANHKTTNAPVHENLTRPTA